MIRTIASIGLATLLVVLVAGCPDDPPSQLDAGSEVDSGEPGTGGITLVFLAEINDPDGGGEGGGGEGGGEGAGSGEEPTGPRLTGADSGHTLDRYLGVPDSQTRVHRVTLQLEEVRAVGDTGAEEQERAELLWDEGDARCVSFATAQPGRYSQIKANVMSYRIEGLTATMTNPDQPFTIEDVPPSGITVVVAIAERNVEIGETTRIPLLFRSHAVADAVEWNELEAGEGGVVVTGESPQIAAVRAAIEEAMVPADEQPIAECTAGPPPDGGDGGE